MWYYKDNASSFHVLDNVILLLFSLLDMYCVELAIIESESENNKDKIKIMDIFFVHMTMPHNSPH
jgi:hypothetical protein